MQIPAITTTASGPGNIFEKFFLFKNGRSQRISMATERTTDEQMRVAIVINRLINSENVLLSVTLDKCFDRRKNP